MNISYHGRCCEIFRCREVGLVFASSLRCENLMRELVYLFWPLRKFYVQAVVSCQGMFCTREYFKESDALKVAQFNPQTLNQIR